MSSGLNKIKHIFFYIFTMAMLLSAMPSIPASAKETAAEDTTKPKVINVIFDDSGSMAMSGRTRWCEAKYALEVFTAMMGEEDTINIYQMSEFDPTADTRSGKIITVKGSDSKRVATVHDMNSTYWNTPVEPIDEAAEDLSSIDEDTSDRWLVVLTDGAVFYEGGTEISKSATQEMLTEKLNGYADDYNVVYLGIGSEAVSISKEASNFYSYVASDTNNEILTRVTDIANLIFEHLILDDSHISGEYSLDIDIPTTQIIVFAQGENVSIGKLKQNGEEIKGESISVKYSDVKPGRYEDAVVNESLKGVVATYNADADSPFSNGTFDIDVTGANTVQFYYKPGVKAVCTLKDADGNPVNAKNGTITEGDYTAEIGFVDPISGEQVESDLLKIEQSEASMTNNEKELTVPGQVTLERGDVRMEVTIDLEGNVRIHNELEYSIEPEALDMSIKLDIPAENYHAEQLGENCTPIIATVIDNKTGQPITKEQWDSCELEVEDSSNDKNIVWDKDLIKKGSETGTWEIRPSAKNDKAVKNLGGKYLFNVTAKMEYDGQTVEPSEGGSITIEQYEGTPIVFEADPVAEPIKLSDLDSFEGIRVTAYTTDEDGNKQVITPEVWEALKVKKTSPTTGRMTWSITKGTETGTYIVKPGYMWKFLKLFTHTGDVSITLLGKGSVGQLYYEGTGTAGLKIEPLTLKEIWMLIWKYLLIAAILIFLIVGYTTKKRINTRRMKPHIALMGKNSGVKYSVSRRLLPYVPERASINCNKPNLMCPISNLQIEATGKNTFKILNAESVLKNGVRINGETVSRDDKDRISRKKYRYSGFTMAPIPPPGAGNVGMFYMSNNN